MSGSSIPATILNKLRPRFILQQDAFQYFDILENILRQLQEQIGVDITGDPILADLSALQSQANANSGNITSLQSQVTSNDSDIATLQSDVADIEALGNYTIVTTGVNYTTTENQIVIATAPCDITLRGSPDDKEFVIVQSAADGDVNVVGAINGSTSIKLRVKYDTIKLIYISSLSRWLIA